MPTPHNPNNAHYIAYYKANNPRRGDKAVSRQTNCEPQKGSIAFVSEQPYYSGKDTYYSGKDTYCEPQLPDGTGEKTLFTLWNNKVEELLNKDANS